MSEIPIASGSSGIQEDPDVSPTAADTNPQHSDQQTVEALKRLNLDKMVTELAEQGKNAKPISEYKFWNTQPVPKFGVEVEGQIEEGPFKVLDLAQVQKEPSPLIDEFEWVTMDMTSEIQVDEVFELLSKNYVEDDDASFRFNYSRSLLKWALLSPGWHQDWHVGVRASASRRLVAFISAIPATIRVRNNVLTASEINFLCVHKKLRGKRLAPLLIKEITRRCHLKQVQHACYTAGVVVPKPISTTRYFHRALDWQKLYDIGFSHLPQNSKAQWQVWKYSLPEHTSTKGLRLMKEKDVEPLLDLATKYLAKFDMAPVFTKEEMEHWFVPKKEGSTEQVIWTYVVENSSTNTITDFFSFYALESSIIGHPRHATVRAAYLFYYASSVGLNENPSSGNSLTLKPRLNSLINDALILAKKAKFDVFNALTVLDNPLFLEQQKFGAGTSQLHYYLYNYRANSIAGGVDGENKLEQKGSGLGVVMM